MGGDDDAGKISRRIADPLNPRFEPSAKLVAGRWWDEAVLGDRRVSRADDDLALADPARVRVLTRSPLPQDALEVPDQVAREGALPNPLEPLLAGGSGAGRKAQESTGSPRCGSRVVMGTRRPAGLAWRVFTSTRLQR
jgi:hypothetical protein